MAATKSQRNSNLPPAILIQRLETVATIEAVEYGDHSMVVAAFMKIGEIFDGDGVGGSLQFAYGGATFRASVEIDE